MLLQSGGNGAPFISVAVGGRVVTVSSPTGKCVAFSNLPFLSKVMVHSIGRGAAAASVNETKAPPCTGTCKTAGTAVGNFWVSVSSVGFAA